MRGIDGDLDSDGTATDFFALEGVDGLLLFGFVTDVDKAVTLAPSGGTPPLSNDASGNNIEASIGKESSKSGVVNAETEVGDKENILGGFADGIFTGGTRGAASPGPAVPGLGRIFCAISCGSISWASVLWFVGPVPVAALRMGEVRRTVRWQRQGRLPDSSSSSSWVSPLLR